MLTVFLTWWGQQLLGLLRRSPAAARLADAVLARVEPGALEVSLRQRGREGTLGRFPLTAPGLASLRAALGARRLPLELRVAPGTMLEQAVVLPLAAERDVARVLGYEMDRLTPFKVEELHWTWAVQERDRTRAQLRVRLWLVMRHQVAPVLDALAAAGLAPAALVGAAGQRIGLGTVAPQPWRRRGMVALGVVCAGLAVAAVALPFVRQGLEAERVERQIAALRPATDRVEALRRGLAASAGGIDVLAAQRARVGDALAVLARVTDLLPDDTVLTDLSLRQRVLTISGQSEAAARLIPALAADPALRNPAFAAPVTRVDGTHGEGFSIRVEAAP